MKKSILFFSLISFFLTSVYSQEVLSSVNSSWEKVVPGELICEPKATSYGFAIITDAKCLVAYSSTGNILWDKPLKRGSNPKFSVLPQDYFAVITNSGKRISLLNPSGNEIWSKNLDTLITDDPFPGRDGRFFVRNNHAIWCYGINGIRKWYLETPEQNTLPIQELPDGSFVIFLSELVQGKTKGLRISPFGEIMEEIIFSGEVVSTVSTPEGILLSFNNGLAGLFSLQNNKAKNKWILQSKNSSNNSRDFFVLSDNQKDALFVNYTGSGVTVNFIDMKKGTIGDSFNAAGLGKITMAVYNYCGIFLTDSDNAYFYDLKGKLQWSGKFPPKTKRSGWNYFTYTPENYLIIFQSDWTVRAFRTTQNLMTPEVVKYVKNYSSFYNIDASQFSTTYMPYKIDESFASEERIEALSKGDYGIKEANWNSMLLSGCYARQNDLISTTSNYGAKAESSIFQKDKAGLEKMLLQLPLTGTDTFITFTSEFISKDSDKAMIKILLIGIINNSYDPQGKILESIYTLARRTSEKEDVILKEICDAIYSICLYNGRPAFYARGKEILTLFLYPKYSSKIRDYARSTFKKISALDM